MKTIYMKSVVNFCDGTRTSYSAPQSGAVMLKEEEGGAWRVASYVGPRYIEEHRIQPLTEEKARVLVEQQGGYLEL